MPAIPGESYEDEVGQYVREHGPIPGLTFQFVPAPRLAWWFQREKPGIVRHSLYYNRLRCLAAGRLPAGRATAPAPQPFDLVHQLNIVCYREPGYLWKLGVPFIWGPVGGAVSMPWPYFSMLGWRDRALYGVRNLVNWLQMRIKQRCRRAARSARHIWATNEDSRRMIAQVWGCPCEVMLESGTQPVPDAAVRNYDGTRPLRLAWSGSHTGRKALPILLHALARLKAHANVEVMILGSGPQSAQCRALAVRLGVEPMIRWLGQLPRAQAVAQVAAADVFVSTSVQEETSLVVTEALSLGLPVICHDACGMGIAVTEACGIKVPSRRTSKSIEGFAAAIQFLSANPSAVQRLSAGALDRAVELSWSANARRMADMYHRVAVPDGSDCAGKTMAHQEVSPCMSA